MVNLSPFQLIQKCNSGDYKTVEENICEFLLGVTKGMEIKLNVSPDMVFGGMSQAQAMQKRVVYVNEWASIIINLFSSPKYTPSKNFLTSLIYFKHSFDWVFSASNWTNTDTLIDRLELLKPNKKGILHLKEPDLLLLMAILCLNTQHKLPWGKFMDANPAVTTTAYIALINQFIPALSKNSMENFNYLLESAKDFPMMVFSDVSEISKFIGCLFNSSYTTSPNKYEFKKWLTQLIRYNCDRGWLSNENKEKIKAIPSIMKKQTGEKRKMLVMIEKLNRMHAMYRCYKLILESLSEVFHLVGVAQESDLDTVAKELFDEVIYVEKDVEINNKVTLILEQNADVIYYPSIGMQLWSLCLSQLRLAPKQIMMAGHPSSSCSQEIDHLLLPGNLISSEELQPYYTENIITSDKSSKNLYVHHQHPDLTEEFIKEHNTFCLHDTDDIINVGINGVMTKVNHSLILLCKEIASRCNKKINFVFFVGVGPASIPYLSVYKQLFKEIKNFELSAYDGYLPYLKEISKCDFLLPTLPFGGSNSNIDAMVLSKPKFYIRGKEQIYTRTDQWEWDRMGLDEELGCETHEELINKAVNLISNNDYRYELYNKMKDICTLDNIFDQSSFSSKQVQDFILQAIDK